MLPRQEKGEEEEEGGLGGAVAGGGVGRGGEQGECADPGDPGGGQQAGRDHIFGVQPGSIQVMKGGRWLPYKIISLLAISVLC